MTNDECAQSGTQSEKNETVFFLLIWIFLEDRPVVVEDSFGFLKRNAVFSFICGVLALVPLEAKIRHESRVYLHCSVVQADRSGT